MQNYLDLTGKVALVTGASSGIGAATSILLADLGARVAIVYHRNQEAAEQLQFSITRTGGRAIFIRADVTQADEIRALVSHTIQEFGPIDILVNNAGSLLYRQRILELTERTWDEVMNLNLRSVMICSQAVASSMIERKTGAILVFPRFCRG